MAGSQRTSSEPQQTTGEPVEASPATAPHGQRARLVRVQRAAGNRAAATMVRRSGALQVGPAADPWEREADSVAQRVVAALQRTTVEDDGRPAPAGAAPARQAPVVHRVLRKAAGNVGLDGGPVDEGFERELRSARGRGAPLDLPVRRKMESAFGTDLSGVRVHDGARSASLNDSISARAFTVGSDIFFRDGVPDADSRSGQELLAHELTHTIQQGGGAARQVSRSPEVVQRLFGRKKTPKPPKPPAKTKKDLLKEAQDKSKDPAATALKTDVAAEDDLHGSINEGSGAANDLFGSTGLVGGQDDYADSMKKSGGKSDIGKSGASEQQSNQLGAIAGASGFVGMFIGVSKAVKAFKDGEGGGEKAGAVLEGVHSGLAGASGMATMVEKGSKATGSYGKDSEGAAKGIGESAKAASFLSGITDAFGGVKEAFFTIKGIVDLVKDANEMTDEEKFKGSMEVIRHALEAAKSSVSAAKTFLDACNSGVTTAMVQSVPGLGIAIGCADMVVRSVDLIVGAIRTHDMRMKKQAIKTDASLLGGKKGESSKAKAEQIISDTTIPEDDPKKIAAHEYLTAKGLQWVNQKRVNRAILKMAVAMAKIAGDAATLGGASAPVGIGLKAGALALDVGASIFRKFKQWMRDKAADSEKERKAQHLQANPTDTDFKLYKKGTAAKIFNIDKSTEKKQAEYNRMVTNIFSMIEKVDATTTPVLPATEAQMNKVADYISAMGYSLKAMSRDFSKDATGAEVRKNMIKAMQKRE